MILLFLSSATGVKNDAMPDFDLIIEGLDFEEAKVLNFKTPPEEHGSWGCYYREALCVCVHAYFIIFILYLLFLYFSYFQDYRIASKSLVLFFFVCLFKH